MGGTKMFYFTRFCISGVCLIHDCKDRLNNLPVLWLLSHLKPPETPPHKGNACGKHLMNVGDNDRHCSELAKVHYGA